jgi:hypothetical protein
VQDILRRMEDAKGVSLKDSAYLKSWLDSATKQAKDNIENNALVSALGSNPDGTPIQLVSKAAIRNTLDQAVKIKV